MRAPCVQSSRSAGSPRAGPAQGRRARSEALLKRPWPEVYGDSHSVVDLSKPG